MPDGTPNVAGMVADPDFQGLAPADKRAALTKLTGDKSFASLNDGDTMRFISRFQKPTIPGAPNGLPPQLQAPLPAGLQGPPNESLEQVNRNMMLAMSNQVTPTLARREGLMSEAEIQKAQEGRKAGTVGGLEILGGGLASEAIPFMEGGMKGLPWAIQALGRGSTIGAGVGAGNVAGQLGTTGTVDPREALAKAAGTTMASVGTEAAVGAGSKAFNFGKAQLQKLSGETPERIAELKQLPQTEEAIRGRVVQAEANSRTAFKSAYDNLGIDAEPVKLADVRPIAKQAAEQIPAYSTPRPLSQVSDIPLPRTADVQAQLGLGGETMHPEEILANLSKYDNIPFRQAQQYRTAIEQYITKANPPGAVYNSLKSVSNGLKSALSQAADNAGKLDGFNAANDMFQQHAADFWNKTAPLKSFLKIPANATGTTLTKFQNVALQGRALQALESRGVPTQDLRAILAKGPKLEADIRDAATLKNLGQPVLNQQVATARREALKPLLVKAGAGLVGGASAAGGLYKLKQALSAKTTGQQR